MGPAKRHQGSPHRAGGTSSLALALLRLCFVVTGTALILAWLLGLATILSSGYGLLGPNAHQREYMARRLALLGNMPSAAEEAWLQQREAFGTSSGTPGLVGAGSSRSSSSTQRGDSGDQGGDPGSESPSSRLGSFPLAHDPKYRIYPTDVGADQSERCRTTHICDFDTSKGADELRLVTSAAERREHVRQAARWTWQGYRCAAPHTVPHSAAQWQWAAMGAVQARFPWHRLPCCPPARRKFAWGIDELDAYSKAGMEWFRVGLTIVDGADTLMILGLEEEAHEARQWIAHHLDLHHRRVSVSQSQQRPRLQGCA